MTTLGSYEVSEGCERKKGQRWGSLERRGMQAMEGEFSQRAFFLSPLPSFPSLFPPHPDPQHSGPGHYPFPSSSELPPPLLKAPALREVLGGSEALITS